MLDRYRKAGGFNQLLSLLETCGPSKQEKFLQIIREQDPNWAQALEIRILSIARIFTWKDTIIAEILPGLPDLTIATCLHGMDATQRDLFCRTMNFSQKRNITELFESGKPAPLEVNASMQKLLLEARRLISTGRLRLNEFDPDLVIPDDIEERLKKGSRSMQPIYNHGASVNDAVPEITNPGFQFEKNASAHVVSVMNAAAQSDATSKLEAALREENLALRKKLALISTENSSLIKDISQLQLKIEQIRKMAA